MNGYVVCVDYADMLARTLPKNAKHFDHVIVVTTLRDSDTIELCRNIPNVSVFATDAFYRKGALFNKGLAMEYAMDAYQPLGWTCIFDADIVMPEWSVDGLEAGNLYSPFRRMCHKPEKWDGGMDWSKFPRFRDREFAGYCQIFRADDPVLAERPWYATNWTHAGGCDSYFQAKWPQQHKIRLPWDVLHLGEPNVNWAGRSDEARARMRDLRSLRAKHGYQHEIITP